MYFSEGSGTHAQGIDHHIVMIRMCFGNTRIIVFCMRKKAGSGVGLGKKCNVLAKMDKTIFLSFDASRALKQSAEKILLVPSCDRG